MPKNIVKTIDDEKKWKKAKSIAKNQGKSKNWALVVHIFQQMKKNEEANSNSKVSAHKDNIKNIKLMKNEQRKAAAAALYNKIAEIRNMLLKADEPKRIRPPQPQTPTAPKSTITQPQTPTSIEAVKPTQGTNKKSGSRFTQWKGTPQLEHEAGKRSNNIYTEQETNAMSPYLNRGFNFRESEVLSGVTDIDRRKNAQFPGHHLHSNTEVSELSPTMLELAQNFYRKHVHAMDALQNEHADPAINPGKALKHLELRHRAEFEAARSEALENLKQSDEFRDLSPERQQKKIDDLTRYFKKPESMAEKHAAERRAVGEKRREKKADIAFNMIYGNSLYEQGRGLGENQVSNIDEATYEPNEDSGELNEDNDENIDSEKQNKNIEIALANRRKLQEEEQSSADLPKKRKKIQDKIFNENKEFKVANAYVQTMFNELLSRKVTGKINALKDRGVQIGEADRSLLEDAALDGLRRALANFDPNKSKLVQFVSGNVDSAITSLLSNSSESVQRWRKKGSEYNKKNPTDLNQAATTGTGSPTAALEDRRGDSDSNVSTGTSTFRNVVDTERYQNRPWWQSEQGKRTLFNQLTPEQKENLSRLIAAKNNKKEDKK